MYNISLSKGNIICYISFMKGNIKNTIKQIMLDFQKAALPNPVPRPLNLPKLPSSVKKAFVFIGMRRSGKTWMLYQVMQQYLASGVSKEQLISFNFEDERLAPLQLEQLQYILDTHYELHPHTINQPLFLFLDEIHVIDGWDKYVRRLLEQEQVTLYLSGSSAKLLSKEIATSLRGRTITREVFPFSFVEYADYFNAPTELPPSTKQRAELLHLLERYQTYGGFPETIEMTPELHHEVLQNYVDTVILRDVIERHQITNVKALYALLRHCLRNAATELSINKQYNRLKSTGLSVSKNSLYQYIDYLEDAYCLFSVEAFNLSSHQNNLRPRKIYPVDPGLITAFSLLSEFDRAAKLETVVFNHLRRQTDCIYYYRTGNNKEIDFLIKDKKEQIDLYQVSLEIDDEQTKQRELSALTDAMRELEVTEGTIITLNSEDSITADTGIITVIPLWQFLLSHQA